MWRLIFILILLTFCRLSQAQTAPEFGGVRLVFLANYQQCPFGVDPVSKRYYRASLPHAVTYIRSYRRYFSDDRFALLRVGNHLAASYRFYPEDFRERIDDEVGFERQVSFERGGLRFEAVELGGDWEENNRTLAAFSAADLRIGLFVSPSANRELVEQARGIDLAVAAFAGEKAGAFPLVNIQGDTIRVINVGASGGFLGVADVALSGALSVKAVDITGFPADTAYRARFSALADSLQAYYDEPITTISETLNQLPALFGSSAYTSLFQRFQMEVSGADISFFAAPVQNDSILAGSLTFGDLLRRFRYDDRLCVVEMTGQEVKDHLERSYARRFHTMRSVGDDLLRLTVGSYGERRTRTPVYYLDAAAGIRYTVHVARPPGRRITILSMADGTPFDPRKIYRVAVSSHWIVASGADFSRERTRRRGLPSGEMTVSGEDYRVLLRDWLRGQPTVVPHLVESWEVLPVAFGEAASAREKDLFGEGYGD